MIDTFFLMYLYFNMSMNVVKMDAFGVSASGGPSSKSHLEKLLNDFLLVEKIKASFDFSPRCKTHF